MWLFMGECQLHWMRLGSILHPPCPPPLSHPWYQPPQGCMTSSILGESKTRDVPRKCSAQSHNAALPHLQPNCASTNLILLLHDLDRGSLPAPASLTALPSTPYSSQAALLGCKAPYRYRCGISGVIPRVTPFKPLPRSLPGWKLSWSAASALLTSHTTHLLLFFSLAPGPARATACLSLPTGSGTWAWQ